MERVELAAKQVIGAAIEVHRALVPGHPEAVYENAMMIELALRCIPYQRQVSYTLIYKDQVVGGGRLDLIVDERLILELKSIDSFAEIHRAQVLAYLNATGIKLGLLINFNVPMLKAGIKRVIL